MKGEKMNERTPEQKKKARKRRALVAKRVFAKIGICVGTFFAANLLEVLLGYLIRDNTPNDSVLAASGELPGIFKEKNHARHPTVHASEALHVLCFW